MTRRYHDSRRFKKFPYHFHDYEDWEMKVIKDDLKHENNATRRNFEEYGLEDPVTDWNDLWSEREELEYLKLDNDEEVDYQHTVTVFDLDQRRSDDIWDWLGKNEVDYKWTIARPYGSLYDNISYNVRFFFKDKDIALIFKMTHG